MYPISPRVIDQQCTLKIGRIKTQRWAQKETKKGFGNEANFGNDYEGEKQDELLCVIYIYIYKEQLIYSSPRASSLVLGC